MSLIYHPLTLFKLFNFKNNLLKIKDLETEEFTNLLILLISIKTSINLNELYNILFLYTNLEKKLKKDLLIKKIENKIKKLFILKDINNNNNTLIDINEVTLKTNKNILYPKFNPKTEILTLINNQLNKLKNTNNEIINLENIDLEKKRKKLIQKNKLNFKKIIIEKSINEKIGIFSKLKIPENYLIFNPFFNYKNNWILKKPKLINPFPVSFIKLFDSKRYIYKHIPKVLNNNIIDLRDKIKDINYDQLSDFIEEDNIGESVSSNTEIIKDSEIEEHESDREFIESTEFNYKTKSFKKPTISSFSLFNIKIITHEIWNDEFLKEKLFKNKIINEKIINKLKIIKKLNFNAEELKLELRKLSLKTNTYLSILQKHFSLI